MNIYFCMHSKSILIFSILYENKVLFFKADVCAVFLSHYQIFYHFHQVLGSLKGELKNNTAL